MPRRARPSCPRSSPAGPGPSLSCRRVRVPSGPGASRAQRAATAGSGGAPKRTVEPGRSASPRGTSRRQSRASDPLCRRGPASRRVIAGRHPVASLGGAASCRVVGSRCPVASWGVGVLSLGSGATSRSAARARHDSGGVTSGGTPRLSLSRARWPSGCRRPGPSLQRASDTENDTDGDSDSGDSGRGGAVGLGRRSSPSADVVPRLAPARVSPTSPPQLSRRRPLARDPRRRCST